MDYLFLCKRIPKIRDLSNKFSSVNFQEENFGGIEHQAKSMHILLSNDIRDNLTEIVNLLTDFSELFQEYREFFPYRLEDKFEEYIRFLGFLLSKDSLVSEVYANVKIRYYIMLSSLKYNRLKPVLDKLFQPEPKDPKYVILNPTVSFLEIGHLDKINKIFFFTPNDIDISMVDLNVGLYKYLKEISGKKINIEEITNYLIYNDFKVTLEDLRNAGVVNFL
jgi:hypothetical protein